MIPPLLLDLFLLLVIAAIGGLGVKLAVSQADSLLIAALAFPLGAGMLTWFVFVVSLIGLHISRATVIGLVLLLIAVMSILLKQSSVAGSQIPAKRMSFQVTWASMLMLLVLGFLLLAVVVTSLMRSYSTWDAMAIWAAKGYGIALEGSIAGAERWGALRLTYPLNAPLMISFFRLISGDIFPGSKLIFPVFGFSLLAFCLRFWLQRRVLPQLALSGALLLTTAPVVFENMTIGYANLPFTAYLVPGFLLILEGRRENSNRKEILAGVLLAFAAWTRIEGAIFSAAAISVAWFSYRPSSLRYRHLASTVIPIAVIIVPWAWFSLAGGSAQESHLAEALDEAVKNLASGVFNLTALVQIGRFMVRTALDPSTWMFLFVLPIAAILWHFVKSRRISDREILAILRGAAAILAIIIAIYYLSAYRQFPSLIDFMYMSFDRSLLPIAFLVALAGLGLAAGRSNETIDA